MLAIWTIIAIIAGPILAVQAQKISEKLNERRKAKLDIYKTLMATRGLTMHFDHVKALNLIDITFKPKRKEKKVIDAWKVYMEYLYKYPQDSNVPDFSTLINAWTVEKQKLFILLLDEMSKVLGYSFDRAQLERHSYTPQGYLDEADYKLFVQGKITSLLKGEFSFPVKITNP